MPMINLNFNLSISLSDDEQSIQTIKLQATVWPNNYKPNNILPLLTSLLLKTNRNGIKIVLLLAKLAERHQWCQELLGKTLGGERMVSK
jgi:integrator complex subunit 5